MITRAKLHLMGVVLTAIPIAACGRGAGSTDVNEPPAGLTVGGSVYTSGGQNENVWLAGVTVTLTPASGADPDVVTTNANGLFEFEDVDEGIYLLMLEMTGYETQRIPLTVSGSFNDAFAFGDDDDGAGSTPTYTDVGPVLLPEAYPAVTVAPFGITLVHAETLTDGTAGLTIEYDLSTMADVVITFDRPVVNSNRPYIQDQQDFGSIYADANAGRTVFTFSGVDIAGLGLAANTKHLLAVQGVATVGPLEGGIYYIDSYVRFEAVP